MEKQNKILIISILSFSVFCFAGYLVYNIIYNGINSKTLPTEVEVEKDEEEQEKLTVSELEKVDIKSKAHIIITHDYTGNNNNIYNGNYISNIYGFIENENLMNNLTIKDEDKLAIALNLMPKMPLTISPDKIQNDFVKNQLATSTFWQVNEADVDKQMISLFGKKAPHKNVTGCPNYYYDSANKVYYGIAECGGITQGFVYLYTSDYKKIDRKTITANIYLAFAGVNEDNSVNIYKNYDGFKSHITDNQTSLYSSAKYPFEYTNNTSRYVGDFVIEEENKNQFQKYTLTFKKNTDDTYYFESIKK